MPRATPRAAPRSASPRTAPDTILRYTAKADVGGKLAQIGSRLIQGTAKKMADDFFGKFSALVGESYAAEAPAAPAPVPRPVPPCGGAGRRQRPAGSGMTAGGDRHDAAACRSRPRHPAAAARQVAFQPERPPQRDHTQVPAPTAKAGQPVCLAIGAIILVILLFWLFG